MRARDAEMPLPPEYNSTLCSLSGPSALGLRKPQLRAYGTRAYGTRYRLQQTAAYGFTGKVSTRLSGSKISYSFSHVSVSQSVNTILNSYQRSTWSTYIGWVGVACTSKNRFLGSAAGCKFSTDRDTGIASLIPDASLIPIQIGTLHAQVCKFWSSVEVW